MDSNYATLNQYYRKQSRENYAEYNSGSFEIFKSANSVVRIMKSTITSKTQPDILPITEIVQSKPVIVYEQIKVFADLLPDNFELKSVEVFQKNNDGVWASSIDPFPNLNISYNNILKEIYIGAKGRTQLFPLVFKDRKTVVKNVTPPPIDETIAKVYITW